MKVLGLFKNKIIFKLILTLASGFFFYTSLNHNLSYRIISIDYYSQNEFSKSIIEGHGISKSMIDGNDLSQKNI